MGPVTSLPVVIVGAGIAGASCARELTAAGVPVVLRERSYVAGGRLSSRTIAGRRVDLGASYLTSRTPEFQAVVDSWVQRGLAREWTDRFAVRTPAGWDDPKPGPVRYGTPGGLRSLVEDLVAGLDVTFRAEVSDVGPGPTVDGEPAAAVVLAMPAPQASDLLAEELAAELAAVEGRDYEPVLSLAAGWSQRCWRDLDGVFVQDDPDLAWVADDGRRRGDGAPVLVAHSTARFAAPNLDRPETAAEPALAALRRVMEIDRPPEWTYLHRWSLARPADPHDEPYHLTDALVGLCGDGWGPPRVETAWCSGRALGRALAERLT
ncbi:MAG TPA: FAD-dependent oxidoreductase [Mycobacteriales bacterium]|nr:FAD-dependent oxidoreductase [Mycobacteriales bacterium]